MNATKTNLGKGLSALLGDEINVLNNEQIDDTITQNSQGYRKLPIAMLSPRADQPRQYFSEDGLIELAESLKNTGMLQPILVRPTPSADNFEIIAGERRWRAAQKAGLHEVPVLVHLLDEQEVLEIALIENMQREDLNAIEEANGLKKLQSKFDYTQEMLAERLGKSRSAIANSLRLLNLSKNIISFIQEGAIHAGHARALVGLEEDIALDIAHQIKNKKLSVRAVEKIIAKIKTPSSTENTSNYIVNERNPNIVDQEQKLQEKLGIKVEIAEKNNDGKITLYFSDQIQYHQIIETLLH